MTPQASQRSDDRLALEWERVELLGQVLADDLLSRGAKQILADVYSAAP